MTDYKNLKLIATSSPHIRGSETTRSIMLDVIIAMSRPTPRAVMSLALLLLIPMPVVRFPLVPVPLSTVRIL